MKARHGAEVENALDRAVAAWTRHAHRNPGRVLAGGLAILAAGVLYARNLEIQGSFVKLLPTEDPTARRYLSTLERKGGTGSAVLVVVESPEPEANRRFIDAVAERVEALPAGLTVGVERGPGEARAFYQKWRWLFADLKDLEVAECELERARDEALILDIDDEPCDDRPRAEGASAEDVAGAGADPAGNGTDDDEGAVGPLRRFERELKARVAKVDRFPTGYFRDPEGRTYVLRIRAPGVGMGEFGSDELHRRVQAIVAEVSARHLHPEMQVGLAGEIPNAIAEREALVADMALVSILGVGLILLSIMVFFLSPFVLVHIGASVGVGTAIAFAVAMAAYGHLNQATSFLVSIVVGNGINHSIVYLARFRERRSLGEPIEEALVDAALACRRGTWLAALAAGGAYGCLLITSFRGFSEFGLIGGVGMVACWTSTFLVLPASVASLEALRKRLLGTRFSRSLATFDYGAGAVAAFACRRGALLLVGAALLSAVAAWPLASYLRNPWEYNFSKLGSQSSKTRGAGRFDDKANAVFGVRGAPVLLMADDASQALDIARQVEERDRDVGGSVYVERVETAWDRLGGSPEVVGRKLAVLGRIRDLIDKALPRLKGEDRDLALEWRPPEWLRPLSAADLPSLLKEAFTERDGRFGTPVYVYLSRGVSQSRGENLLKIAEILEGVHLPDGRIVPNASRATVFAAMIRSMEHDAPRATGAAALLVVLVTLVVTRRLLAVGAVLGSLLCGVLLTVGGAAWLDVRLNFLNFVAIPLTFGIGVEYAINLFERVRVHGFDVASGVRSAGGPVFLCSLTTIIGYSALIAADNRALQSFGKYAIAGELACIGTALLLLPAALTRFGRRAEARERIAAPQELVAPAGRASGEPES